MKKIGLIATCLLLTWLMACSKTIPYTPNPAKITEDPFALLERLIQSEGIYAPALFEITPTFFKSVYAGPTTYTVYFDDIGKTEIVCKGDKYCSVFVHKKNGDRSYWYTTRSQQIAKTFLDTLFAARDAAAAMQGR